MESSAIFRLPSHLPSFPTPKPNKAQSFLSSKPWKHNTASKPPTHVQCGKMFVPGFGEASPEAKAANNLHQFFTFIAVKIVSAQLEVVFVSTRFRFRVGKFRPNPLFSGRVRVVFFVSCQLLPPLVPYACGRDLWDRLHEPISKSDNIVLSEQSYNPEAYKDLMEFMDKHSLNDGDKFCADLMRESSEHKSLALRILEVRSAYCKNDFEWDNLQRLAVQMVNESNTKIMRDYVQETSH